MLKTHNISIKINKLAAAGLLCFISFCAMAQVRTKVDTTSIRIGEELRISFEIQADSIDLVVFPDQQTFMPLEVIESYATDTTYSNSKIKYRKQYGLTQFDSGRYTIPRQKIIFNNTFVLSDSINVQVRDVVVDTTKQKMFDIKPSMAVAKAPFKVPTGIYWFILLAGVIVLVWYFLRRKKKKEQAKKQLPAYQEALVALQELDSSSYLIQNNAKEYYSLLTEIVKRYLDREVDNAALESTTQELIERLNTLKKSGNFDFKTQDIKRLDTILKRADLVKFAKMQQGSGQAQADRATIEEVISNTQQAIPEPTQEELMRDTLYQQALKRKKLRKKIVVAASSLGVVLLISTVVFSSLYGIGTLKETVFGNSLKDTLDGRWFKSQYGAPGLIVTTPEILVRQLPKNINDSTYVSTSVSRFTSGAIGEDLYVSLSITKIAQQSSSEDQQIAVATGIENTLETLENAGALNLVAKQEAFSSEEGLKGVKAYGDFNLKLPNGAISKEKMSYEILLFDQQNTLQMVTVVFQRDKEYANQIKERIINSIEVPVSPQAQNKTQSQDAQ